MAFLLTLLQILTLGQLSFSPANAEASFGSIIIPETSYANSELNSPLALVQGGYLIGETSPANVSTRWTTITAYSSTPDQTDESPFISANGTRVYDGMIAANFLPFGTRVYIPELFGAKEFVVHDRMHSRFQHTVDVWMETRSEARTFGVQYAKIVVIND